MAIDAVQCISINTSAFNISPAMDHNPVNGLRAARRRGLRVYLSSLMTTNNLCKCLQDERNIAIVTTHPHMA